MTSGPCVNCGRSAGVVNFIAKGAAALSLGVDTATADVGVVYRSQRLCDECLARSDAEAADLRAERRRLALRGLSAEDANRIMCRRVDRYFKSGRLVPFGKAAVA